MTTHVPEKQRFAQITIQTSEENRNVVLLFFPFIISNVFDRIQMFQNFRTYDFILFNLYFFLQKTIMAAAYGYEKVEQQHVNNEVKLDDIELKKYKDELYNLKGEEYDDDEEVGEEEIIEESTLENAR